MRCGMINKDNGTLENILNAGKEEFLEKGFLSSSLRNIVKKANVTTGEFYGYFSNKEALFSGLVEEQAKTVMHMFMESQEEFDSIPDENKRENMGSCSGDCISRCVEYIYDNFDIFKLIICCSQGTPYEHFIHNMVEVEVDSTLRYMEVLRRLGKDIPPLSRSLCHIIASGMFNGLFEIVIHDMPREQAFRDVAQFRDFYTAGWLKLMGQ